jgi:hypothetical protein
MPCGDWAIIVVDTNPRVILMKKTRRLDLKEGDDIMCKIVYRSSIVFIDIAR